MTLTLGTWLWPFAVTMAVWAWAIFKLPGDARRREFTDLVDAATSVADAFVATVRLGIALIVSLIAWLVWAICIIVQAPH